MSNERGKHHWLQKLAGALADLLAHRRAACKTRKNVTRVLKLIMNISDFVQGSTLDSYKMNDFSVCLYSKFARVPRVRIQFLQKSKLEYTLTLFLLLSWGKRKKGRKAKSLHGKCTEAKTKTSKGSGKKVRERERERETVFIREKIESGKVAQDLTSQQAIPPQLSHNHGNK